MLRYLNTKKPFQFALRHMNIDKTYSETLSALNRLIIVGQPKTARPPDTSQTWNVDAMKFYLQHMNIDLSKLSFIHVAGTKGKGSTCAFCESVLRKAGYKTGLYTSPHLIDVRERVRINGVPVDKESFIRNFWTCYEELENNKNEMFPSMATYFRFLTLVSFKVFIEQGVDVAIIEVGLGGKYDATNVITPAVAGITSIGYDHIEILGDTLEKIAWQKAGIMKPNVITITSPQKESVLNTFIDVAKQVESPLFVSPTIHDFESFSQLEKIPLGLGGSHQQINAALALCLCDAWINRVKHPLGVGQYPLFIPTETQLQGLKECTYEGRAQIVSVPPVTFYLDGAHTDESIEFCANWFRDCMSGKIPSTPTREEMDYSDLDDEELIEIMNSSQQRNITREHTRVLLFNFTGMRDTAELLQPLANQADLFDHVIFCPNDSDKDSLTVKKTQMDEQQEQKMNMIKSVWEKISEKEGMVKPSINDALKWIWEQSKTSDMVSVLVTGSFYLVGDVLRKIHKMK